ncbi:MULTISPECIES: hypothetical protein [Citrobacter]|uniref:hypothetical protein n=1 Tax=Citrobacter TaxID=544 RepID=UPI001A19BEF1|nr:MULTISPECIES: hypothetical protein [Citrobacter]MDM3052069.1 hypothetical protein [Citrobacter sp. CK183]MEB2702260.1 hypothetical protein [Citrobacter koseri]MEB2708594.1 hypothetical protein [Citrobacter koseri]MEB2771056.1 hypothetical protein [Citrobacter koseri]WOJ27643.1 hypothetical protein R1221_07365 [Citrobacter koseri]
MAQRSSLEDISLPGSVDAIPDSTSVTDEQASPEKHPALVLQEVEDRIADRALREKFGDKAYKVVRKTLYGWCWLLAIYAALKFRFQVEIFSDNVLIAITSAVTLNVFAAFLGVIRGLFPATKPTKD